MRCDKWNSPGKVYLDVLSLETEKSHVYYTVQFSPMHNSLSFLQTLSKVEYSHTVVHDILRIK